MTGITVPDEVAGKFTDFKLKVQPRTHAHTHTHIIFRTHLSLT